MATLTTKTEFIVIKTLRLEKGWSVEWIYSNFGDRCFAAAGPRLSNSLPAGLRQTDIGYEQFKWLVKTCLFGR